jgi:hypothetical protein
VKFSTSKMLFSVPFFFLLSSFALTFEWVVYENDQKCKLLPADYQLLQTVFNTIIEIKELDNSNSVEKETRGQLLANLKENLHQIENQQVFNLRFILKGATHIEWMIFEDTQDMRSITHHLRIMPHTTLLIELIALGDCEIIEFLLQNGADPNLICNFNTPVVQACKTDNHLILKHLLENQADPNIKEQYSYDFPLHIAAKRGSVLQVYLLLEHGASLNKENRLSRTAIADLFLWLKGYNGAKAIGATLPSTELDESTNTKAFNLMQTIIFLLLKQGVPQTVSRFDVFYDSDLKIFNIKFFEFVQYIADRSNLFGQNALLLWDGNKYVTQKIDVTVDNGKDLKDLLATFEPTYFWNALISLNNKIGISDNLISYVDQTPDPRNTLFSNFTKFFNSQPNEKARLPAELIRTLRSELGNRDL